MVASTNPARLDLAFDIGHSSIGWAVLSITSTALYPDVLGCGVVTFEKDGALANQRRLHRSQRRHIRATRLRIARMEKLFTHLGVLRPDEISSKHQASGGHSAPWLLAARVLASNGERTLTWLELWDVLRWYAHNRGYEEIGTEAAKDDEDADEDGSDDAEKVVNAKAAMAQFGKATMAETICAWLGLDPLGKQQASRENYKARNCAFERCVVVSEVRRVLEAHLGKLPSINEALIDTLLDDAHAIAVPTIKLPRRYRGSLLFGRLETRYHNRIIGRCPISGEKIPNKNTPEFLRFRWGMQLANIRVGAETGDLRPLTIEERQILHHSMCAAGHLGVRELKQIVRSMIGVVRDNLDSLLLHPDAKDAFIFDPAQKLVTSHPALSAVWPHLPVQIQKRTLGRLRRGKRITIGNLRNEAASLGQDITAFDAALGSAHSSSSKKQKNKTTPAACEDILSELLDIRRDLARLSGRAPYSRTLLSKAYAEVMQGMDPKAKGGCLEETDEVRRRRESRPIAHQTNNHLIRHRLLILSRLVRDIIGDKKYLAGDPARIGQVTVEVNRDLRQMSGFTAQDIAKELGARLSSHKKVSARLEKELAGTAINAGLIRKARVADDLGWRCPYTGIDFEPVDLIEKRVDKDHIIPRSQRPTDSLDALVVTFAAINKWKGKRTAWQFVQDEGGKPVPDDPRLSIMPMNRFKDFVAKLDTKGHDDDVRRKKRRKEFLLLERYEEKSGGFTHGQLTQTSQLARLAAQVVRAPFEHLSEPPTIVALPGSVTGSVRRSWDLLGCLSSAAPDVMENGASSFVKTKTEIREITHLHHALDACVIGLAAFLFPNRGDVWKLLTERRLRPEQQRQLAEILPTKLLDFDAQGSFRLRDLPDVVKNQIRVCLAERRVVQHIPHDMNGLRVEENTRGILKRENSRVFLRQRKPNSDGKVVINETAELESKVVGLASASDGGGKLARLKGVRVISDNYGVAILNDEKLPPETRFVIIPFANVWKQIALLNERNGGKHPTIFRNGQILHLKDGKRAGYWRIFSIKNNTSGMALDLGPVDALKPTWINCLLKSLLRDKAQKLNTTLTGADI